VSCACCRKKVKFDLNFFLNGGWIRTTLNAPYNFHLKVKLSSCLLKHHAIKTYESVQHQASVVSGQVYDPTALPPLTDISVHTGWVEADWAAEPMSTLSRIKPQSIDSPAGRLHTVSQISVTLSADPTTKLIHIRLVLSEVKHSH
jgi:hypothetical protein